jgi:alpha-L-arabinofuranosidase
VGAERAGDGHPAAFKIEYVEIGNEDWFDESRSYDARYAQFADAIKARYPKLKLIATMPIRSRTPDVYDEHFYLSPANMERDVHHYDNRSRSGPKVFVGEWAAQEGTPTPNMNSALGDASWLIGLERNADLVVMQCYAPLLVNVNPGASQWGTNLIGFDALRSYGSPSYHVLKMFGQNQGNTLLPVDVAAQSVPHTEPAPLIGGVGVGAWNTQAEFSGFKVTAGQSVLSDSNYSDPHWMFGDGDWTTKNGAIQQTSVTENNTAIAVGGSNWGDYTYTLRARKTGGNEGFLILFHARSANNLIWWNVGGWGNTRTQIERSDDGTKTELGRSSPVGVETGRWYDVKIELQGHHIRCYLDGALVSEADDLLPAPPGPVFASASRDGGDVILKVVNVGADVQHLQVDLRGVRRAGSTLRAEVMSADPSSTNSIDDPDRVTPAVSTGHVDAPSFPYEFPAHSVSVLRVRAE